MKERGILFSAPMVRALLAGTKTQTRRIVKPQPIMPVDRPLRYKAKHPASYFDAYCSERKTNENPRGMSERWCWWTADDRPDPLSEIRCPYGRPGDRLWVRETWQALHFSPAYDDCGYSTGYADDWHAPEKIPTNDNGGWWKAVYAATDEFAKEHRDDRGFGWRPGIHMPRWASRITLEVVGVRVERVQDISESDAQAEGVRPFFEVYDNIGRDQRICTGELARDYPYRASFACLWDEINGDRSLWSANPWVWTVEFKRIDLVSPLDDAGKGRG